MVNIQNIILMDKYQININIKMGKIMGNIFVTIKMVKYKQNMKLKKEK